MLSLKHTVFSQPNVDGGQYKVEKPNVDVKTHCFFHNPMLMGTALGEKNPTMTYKHAVILQPNVDGYHIELTMI